MSLKARLRRPIVALVALIVVVMSLLYLSDFTRISFQGAADRADLVAEQFKLYLANHLNLEMNRHGMRPVSVADWENGWTEIIRRDPDITDMLNRTLGQADLALAILVTDRHGIFWLPRPREPPAGCSHPPRTFTRSKAACGS